MCRFCSVSTPVQTHVSDPAWYVFNSQPFQALVAVGTNFVGLYKVEVVQFALIAFALFYNVRRMC